MLEKHEERTMRINTANIGPFIADNQTKALIRAKGRT
jgi:hypothetical protein